nr:immunoglobulin heavy chain junction region [Macaca mulatta]
CARSGVIYVWSLDYW